MVDQAKIAKLVEEELRKVLSGSRPTPSSPAAPTIESTGKKILVVYTGTDIGLKESAEQIKKLRQKGYGFSLALSKQAAHNPGANKISELTGVTHIIPESEGDGILKILNEHVGVMIGTLSRNSALKLSNGITDSFILYLIYLAIVSKMAVVAAKNGVDPSQGEMEKFGLPQYPNDLIATIVSQLQKLERWGMKLVDVKQLADETEKAIKIATGTIEKVDEMTPYGTERPLISEREIRQADKSGTKKITLKPGTIVTPLARDLANQLGITLE